MAIIAVLNTASIGVDTGDSLQATDPRKAMRPPVAGTYDKSSLPDNGNVTADPLGPFTYIELNSFSGNEFWLHFILKDADSNSDFAMEFLDAAGTELFKYDGDQAGTSLINNIDDVEDFRAGMNGTVDIHFTNGGKTKYYVNDALVGEGITTVSWTGAIDRIRVGVDTFQFSEFMVGDSDTRGYRLVTLELTGTGTVNEMTGTAADITGQSLDESTMVSTDTIAMQTFTIEDLPGDLGNMIPEAVCLSTIANASTGSPAPIYTDIVHDGTNHADLGESSFLGLDSAHKPITNIMHTNPLTGSKWSIGEINALEVGMRTIPYTIAARLEFGTNTVRWELDGSFGTLVSGSPAVGAGMLKTVYIGRDGDVVVRWDVPHGWTTATVSFFQQDGMRLTKNLTALDTETMSVLDDPEAKAFFEALEVVNDKDIAITVTGS